SADAFDRQFLFVEGRGRVLRVVLNREASDTCLDAELYICSHVLRFVSKPVQEICVYGQRGRFDDFADVREHFITRNTAIVFSTRKSKACRSSGERFESEVFKMDHGSNVPRIWKHEAPGLVQCAKCCSGRSLFR